MEEISSARVEIYDQSEMQSLIHEMSSWVEGSLISCGQVRAIFVAVEMKTFALKLIENSVAAFVQGMGSHGVLEMMIWAA